MPKLRTATLMLAALAPLAASAGEVLNREYNQQQRVAQGIDNGRLTAGETARLENRQARINATRRADLAANGGHLTRGEHRNLNARENAVSGSIYADKHNGSAQPGVTPR